jgi:hypothetical protein
MKKIVLVLSLIVLAGPAYAAPNRHDQAGAQAGAQAGTLEKKCHEIMANQQVEGEGRSHMAQLQMQRFSNCMMGEPY